MMGKLLKAVKRVIFAFLLLYGLNLLVNSFDVLIPINVLTISLVSVLGVPGLVSLVVMFFIVR